MAMARASMRFMHPIERLRAVARAGWAGPSDLGAEAAWALADLAEREPSAVLPSCRRLLEFHPDCGPLWWVAARILTAGDQMAEGEWCGDAFMTDPTSELLEDMEEGGRLVRHGGMGEVVGASAVVVVVSALGYGGMVIDADDMGVIEAARAAEVPIWVEGGVGRVLPARLWDALVARIDTCGHARSGLVVDLAGVDVVVGPDGGQSVPIALASTNCPEPAELLASW